MIIGPIGFVKRYRFIAGVLLKHGFGYFLKELQLHSMLPLSQRIMRSGLGREISLPFPVRARLVLEELGVVSTKFGQFLSTRPDIVSPELAVELAKLQDNVKPFEFKFARERIEKELKVPLGELFEYIEEKPLASASIGQVHRARLKNGKTVIVKVQRPGIEESIEIDLAILMDLARLAEKHMASMRSLGPVALVEEFSRSLRRELDYVREGRNAERFRKNFKGIEYVHIPVVYWDYTTKHVLTMEYLKGIKVSDVDKIRKAKLNPKKIAEYGAKTFMKQVLVDGFFHADPHPGNIFVTKKGMIAFMDFGMTGFLDLKTKKELANLFISIIAQDTEKTMEWLFRIIRVDSTADLEGFKRDVNEMIAQYYGVSLKEVEIGGLLNELIALAHTYRVKVPSNLLLLVKAMITIEGIGRQLDPGFNLAKVAQPFAKKLLKERLSPKRIMQKWAENLLELNDLGAELPSRLNRILQKIEAGSLKMDVQHQGLGEFTSELNKSSNRIAISLIISAIIVGSSLIIISNKGPFVFGMPAIGLAGFCFAALLGALLVVSMLRTGKF